jgi:hypothetical protein
MRKLVDRTGQRFGKLTAKKPIRTRNKNNKVVIFWECVCECGNTTKVHSSALLIAKSCGCFRKEISKKMIALNTKHGESGENKTDIYGLWKGIKSRVRSTSIGSYKHYLEKGIIVCDEWESNYLIFKKWCLDNGYKKGLLIDRINNDKGYYPENCRFLTPKESSRNKSNNRYLTYKGERKTVAEWAEITGIKRDTLSGRLSLGWSIEKLLSTSVRKYFCQK